jgi:hypothetical protein
LTALRYRAGYARESVGPIQPLVRHIPNKGHVAKEAARGSNVPALCTPSAPSRLFQRFEFCRTFEYRPANRPRRASPRRPRRASPRRAGPRRADQHHRRDSIEPRVQAPRRITNGTGYCIRDIPASSHQLPRPSSCDSLRPKFGSANTLGVALPDHNVPLPCGVLSPGRAGQETSCILVAIRSTQCHQAQLVVLFS